MLSLEVGLLFLQALILYRILRDLNTIDLDRLFAVIKPSASSAPSAGACISDEPLTKEQRELFVELNSSGVCGYQGEDLLRVLFHCGFDRQLAQQKLADNRAWANTVKPKEVMPAQLGNSLPSGAWRLGGLSRCGWPIVQCYIQHWQPHTYDKEEHHCLMAFVFEHSLQRLPAGQDRLAFIFDLSSYRASHSLPHPLSLTMSLVKLTQGPYAERLGVVLLINAPMVFRATWALIQPLASNRSLSRAFVLGSDWQEKVAEYIDDANLPDKLGGKHPTAGPPYFGFI